MKTLIANTEAVSIAGQITVSKLGCCYPPRLPIADSTKGCSFYYPRQSRPLQHF